MFFIPKSSEVLREIRKEFLNRHLFENEESFLKKAVNIMNKYLKKYNSKVSLEDLKD